jgi:hypothetical protein
MAWIIYSLSESQKMGTKGQEIIFELFRRHLKYKEDIILVCAFLGKI